MVSAESAAGTPPKSISRSTASTPTPPPLVRIASRLPATVADAAERLGGLEQLAEVEDPQQAGAPEGGVVDRVGAGERAGMGGGRLAPPGRGARP